MLRKYLYIFGLAFSSQLFSQILPFKNYGIKDGLSTKLINAAIKDNRGLLWIGTPYGVNWFDGKNFYQPVIQSPAGQLYVTDFYKDDAGNIWILTFYNGIYRFKNNRFQNFLINPAVLSSTSNNVFDMAQIDSSNYAIATDDGLYIFDCKQFLRIDTKPYHSYNTIAKLPDGNIVAGDGTGLFFYKKQNNKWINYLRDPNISVNKIRARGNKIFIATSNGILKFENTIADIAKPDKHFLVNQNVATVEVNAKGDIWAIGNKKYKIINDTVFSYDEKNGLPSAVRRIYPDDEGQVWFCTEKGLYKLSTEHFRFDYLNKQHKDEGVTSLAYSPDNTLWVGTGLGLFKNVKGSYEYNYFSKLDKKKLGYVAWIHLTKQKKLLAGTDAGIIDLSQSKIKLKYPLVSAVCFEDDDGHLWLATIYGDIYSIYNDHVTFMPQINGKSEFITSIVKDHNNYLWIGYRNGGIKIFDQRNDTLLCIKSIDQLGQNSNLQIRCCKPDKNGNLIFGTRTNGIYIVSVTTKKWWHFDESNGLNATWVKDVTVTGDTIYLATNNGLQVLSGDYDHPFIKQIKFNSEIIFPEENNVLYHDSVCIAGNNGVLYYYPFKDKMYNSDISVLFTQIIFSGNYDSVFYPYSVPDKKFSLSYYQNNISFEYAGIDLQNEYPLHYRYMLYGLDKTWNAETERNFVSYDLQPGDYTFKVQAQKEDGTWSNKISEIHFNIRNPFWRTWWFILLMIIAAVMIVYMIYQYRLRQVLKLEKLRTKISTDLHDDIGSTLSSISILSDMAANENNKAQSKEMMFEIKENSLLLMEKMDDIVWSINPGKDTLEDLLLRIKRFASNIFEAKNIEYNFYIDDSVKDIKLPMEYRQHIYLILKEAINNIVKYSNCSEANIEVKHHHNKILNLHLWDNGIGFDRNKIKYGNGIISMQQRSKAIGSKLIIESKPGNGTTIDLEVRIK